MPGVIALSHRWGAALAPLGSRSHGRKKADPQSRVQEPVTTSCTEGQALKQRARARPGSGRARHLCPTPPGFQGLRGKAASTRHRSPQGPPRGRMDRARRPTWGVLWQGRGGGSWGRMGVADRTDGFGEASSGQEGARLTSRGTERHRDGCVLGEPMSPGSWDPVSSWALHMLPGLPRLGSRGVWVGQCPQILVSRRRQNRHPSAPHPTVPLSAAQSPRDKKKEKLLGCHPISLLRVTGQQHACPQVTAGQAPSHPHFGTDPRGPAGSSPALPTLPGGGSCLCAGRWQRHSHPSSAPLGVDFLTVMAVRGLQTPQVPPRQTGSSYRDPVQG